MRVKQSTAVVCLVAAWAWLGGAAPAQALDGARASAVSSTDETGAVTWRQEYLRTPLRFEPNAGRSDERVRFVARGLGYGLFVTDEGAVLDLRRGLSCDAAEQDPHRPGARCERTGDVLALRLVGARKPAAVAGSEELPGRVRSYLGSDPARWRADLPAFGRVTLHEVYRGIDLTYYGNQGQLEYDLLVKPGADPRAIRVRFDGAQRVTLEAGGDLRVETRHGTLHHRAPLVYQDRQGGRREVRARYVRRGAREFGLELGHYDRRAALVVDPVLIFSTYLGGTNVSSEERAEAVAVDAAGQVVVAGYTGSLDFPLLNPAQGTYGGGTWDVFVTKFQPSGSALVYSTFVGGNDSDTPDALTVDAAGNAYVSGSTRSSNFPTLNAYQPALVGFSDAFVTKLSNGGALVYSTYLGGSGGETAAAVAVNAASEATVVGTTSSTGFPTVVPFFQGDQPGLDIFVSRLSAAGNTLLASTYLGGSSSDNGLGLALGPGGNVYVAGYSSSTDFPLQGPVQTDQPATDVVVAQLNPGLSALIYSTYLGGSGSDYGLDIAVEPRGAATVVGYTTSTDFPVLGAIQGDQPDNDGFVARLAPTGAALEFSTYLGGAGSDIIGYVRVDAAGYAHVAGATNSTDLPVLNAFDASLGGSEDLFLARLVPNGGALTFLTYLGGSSYETPGAFALDALGNLYIVGRSDSGDYPTLNAYQGVLRGGWDACVTKLSGFVKGDFNRDGQTDLLFRNLVNSQLDVWHLAGTTRSGTPATVSPAISSLDWQLRGVDDFNRDERNDLALWNATSGAVEFWLMNGTTRLGAPVALAGTPAPPWRLIATADFNRDGWPDLFWRNDTTLKLLIWTMNGTSKLGEIVPVPDQAVAYNWEVAAALDYNADGYTDLLWYNRDSGKIVLWFMDANVQRLVGQFANPANAGNNNWKVLAGGDYGMGPDSSDVPPPVAGSKDIVWRNETSGKVVIWHMDFAGNRTAGLFLTPDSPSPNPLDWTVAGPR